MNFKKSLSKLVNFCVAILILKMEEYKQHFQHIMLYYFKKDKNTIETYTQKDLWNVCGRCCDWSSFRSGLWCFMLEISHWTILHRSGRPVEVDSNQISLFENSQRYTLQEIVDILKISKSIKLLVKMKNVSFGTTQYYGSIDENMDLVILLGFFGHCWFFSELWYSNSVWFI